MVTRFQWDVYKLKCYRWIFSWFFFFSLSPEDQFQNRTWFLPFTRTIRELSSLLVFSLFFGTIFFILRFILVYWYFTYLLFNSLLWDQSIEIISLWCKRIRFELIYCIWRMLILKISIVCNMAIRHELFVVLQNY